MFFFVLFCQIDDDERSGNFFKFGLDHLKKTMIISIIIIIFIDEILIKIIINKG